MDGWVHGMGWVGGMNEWINGWMGGGMNEWINGWMGGGINGWIDWLVG